MDEELRRYWKKYHSLNPKPKQMMGEQLDELYQTRSRAIRHGQALWWGVLALGLLAAILLGILALNEIPASIMVGSFLNWIRAIPSVAISAAWIVAGLSLILYVVILFRILVLADRAAFTSAWKRISLNNLRKVVLATCLVVLLMFVSKEPLIALFGYAFLTVMTFYIYRHLRLAIRPKQL